MSPGVPLLLGLVFCRDQGIWAQTDESRRKCSGFELMQKENTAEIDVQNADTENRGHLRRPQTYLKSTKTLLKKDPLPSCLGLLPSSSSRSSSSSSFSSACAAVEANRVPLIMRPRANRILTAPTLAWTSQKKIPTMSRCTSHQRRTGRGTCRSTPRNAHGAFLSPPLSRTRIPSWRVRFHSHLAALRTPQYSPAWTRLHFIQRAELELAVCPPWRKGPLRSVRTLLPLLHLGSPSPHFGAPRRLKNTEALSVIEKFWDMRDGTFPAVSVNKGYHSHGR